MIYYGEELIKEGQCVEIVKTAKGDLELREKTGTLIRGLTDYEATQGNLNDIIKQNDWTPTIMERYQIEISKPTRAEMFIKDVARATGATEHAIRLWVTFGTKTNDFAVIKKLEKLFGQSYETLFNKDRNKEVEKKYRRHKRVCNTNKLKNEEEHGKD